MSDPQQRQMIREAMKAIAERRPGRTKLVYDKTKRTIVAVTENAQTPRALNITAEDADMFGEITVSTKWLEQHWPELSKGNSVSIIFSKWDDGDTLTQSDLGVLPANATIQGTVSLKGGPASSKDDHASIVLKSPDGSTPGVSTFTAPDGQIYTAKGSKTMDGKEEVTVVNVIDIQPALAARRSGILETTILNDKTVLFIGVGTGGAHAAVELAKCGVGSFILVDGDRLSAGNVVRHPGGISHVGRLKVNLVRDLILEKNPDAQVRCFDLKLTHDNLDAIRPLVIESDVVVCGTDGRESKLLVNRLCIEENTVAIYGGGFRRVYGGQVLRVRPKESACHQCFVSAMPDEASDVEISSTDAAESVAYSDRPVKPEPGLSLDLTPIVNMLEKLTLLELLADKSSTLNSLKRDYAAPWYLWLNRPEPNTPYASWPPLSESSDEMTINRWYGIEIDRDPNCPVCGNFIASIAASYGLDPNSLPAVPAAPTNN